jgi:hypothetical protein
MNAEMESKPIFIYFHIASMRYGTSIFKQIAKDIKTSGLDMAASEIHLSIVGVKKMRISLPGNVFIHENSNLQTGEFVTLKLLESHALLAPNGKFLYIHTKGITKYWNRPIRDWRKYMTFFMIQNFRRCIEILDTCDACGVDLVDEPVRHFSGNFWWARGDYINSLPRIEDISSDRAEFILTLRHNAEFWIGMGNGDLFSLWNSGIDVYKRHLIRYRSSNYIGINEIQGDSSNP